MSHKVTLGRRRTVRFPAALDRRLLAEAANDNKTISDVIREKVEASLEHRQTASERILGIAASPQKLAREGEFAKAFRTAYTRRHEP